MKAVLSASQKGLLLLGLILFVPPWLTGCNESFFSSGGNVIKRLESPEGDMVAVVYEGGGGALGDNSSSVNIFESSEEVATISHKLITKGLVFLVKGKPKINLDWKSFNEIEIEYVGGMGLVNHKNHYLGVTSLLKGSKVTSDK